MQTLGKRASVDAVPAQPVHLHLPLQHARRHPDPRRCRPRPASRSRCSSPCSCGSSTSASASSTRASGTSTTLLWPPGVPMALKPLVGPSSSSRPSSCAPFSLTVRLFANMLAGHILLVTFALLTEALLFAETQAGVPHADERPAVRHADLPHRLRSAGRPSCRPTSSRSSPPCTSTTRRRVTPTSTELADRPIPIASPSDLPSTESTQEKSNPWKHSAH